MAINYPVMTKASLISEASNDDLINACLDLMHDEQVKRFYMARAELQNRKRRLEYSLRQIDAAIRE